MTEETFVTSSFSVEGPSFLRPQYASARSERVSRDPADEEDKERNKVHAVTEFSRPVNHNSVKGQTGERGWIEGREGRERECVCVGGGGGELGKEREKERAGAHQRQRRRRRERKVEREGGRERGRRGGGRGETARRGERDGGGGGGGGRRKYFIEKQYMFISRGELDSRKM